MASRRTKARSISVFQPVGIPSPGPVPAGSRDVRAAPDNDLVSDDSRARVLRFARRKETPRTLNYTALYRPARRARRCVPGASARERGGRHAEYRAYANRPGASRLSSAQARIQACPGVRGKRARRDATDRRAQISLARLFIRRNDAHPARRAVAGFWKRNSGTARTELRRLTLGL